MSDSIDITRTGDTTFRVVVHSKVNTTHEVTVQPHYHTRLAGTSATPEQLIRKSFEFLLEREPNTAILRSFDLHVIGQYFPEFETSMKTVFLPS